MKIYFYIRGAVNDENANEVEYQCQRCGTCCRWEGEVCVDDEEIKLIANFLGIDELSFIQQYCSLRRNRQGLTLNSIADGACIMLENNNCRIQPVKPTQCQGFPNKWNFPGWREKCSAIPVPKRLGAEHH